MEDWIASLPKNERKFVRGWTTDELAGRIESVVEERSTENGKKVYQELGCIQCHRIADEGGGAGPDLTRIATKLTPAQIVQSIVEPSATIAPEYTLTMLTTTDGRVVTGRIEFENEDLIRLRSPQSFDVPITIPTAEIDARALSKVSMMPAEMLNTCSEEEIFDLVSYLLSVSKNANVDTSSP